MSHLNKSALALHGGPAAVTQHAKLVSPLSLDALKAALGRLIDGSIFSNVSPDGPIAQFEQAFAAFVGAPHCLSFSNGTSALLCAYLAAGVGPGDEVVHPCYSWISAIAPAVQVGARPVFCNVDPHSMLCDPASLERNITDRTKAISVVHMHGNVCDMDMICAIARRHKLVLIEDCSHCHGAQWRGESCGLLGDIGCFSLQGAPIGGKAVTGGEGGIAVTRSRDLYERMLLVGHINRWPSGGRFGRDHWDRLAPLNVGMKYRMHPWAAACASLMLERVSETNEKKRVIRSRVKKALDGCDALCLVESTEGSVPAGFYGGLNLIYRPNLAHDVPAGDVLSALVAEGGMVGRAPCPLLHTQPFFTSDDRLRDLLPGRERMADASFPRAEATHANILNILHPMNLEPDDPYIAQLLDSVGKVFGHIARHRSLSPQPAPDRRRPPTRRVQPQGSGDRGAGPLRLQT